MLGAALDGCAVSAVLSGEAVDAREIE